MSDVKLQLESIGPKYMGKTDLKSVESEYRERIEAEEKFWNHLDTSNTNPDDSQKAALIESGMRKEELSVKLADLRALDGLRNRTIDERKEMDRPVNALQTPGYEENRRERAGGKSLGEQFISDPQVKAFLKQFEGKGVPQGQRIESPKFATNGKALITANGDAVGGAFTRPYYDTAVELPHRPLKLRDLISTGTTDSDKVEFIQVTGRTNAAGMLSQPATVAGAVTKPESALAFARVDTLVKIIATWFPATRQIVRHATEIMDVLNQDLPYLLEDKLEYEMISGDGTGDNLLGILNTSGLTVQALDAGSPYPILRTLRKAKTKAQVTGLVEPTAYLMNPNDQETVDLLVDGQNRFLFGGPVGDDGQSRIWNLPVVTSVAMPAGSALTGDFKQAKLWDRDQAQIFMSDSHGNFFLQNLIAILAEMSVAFGVKRPAALVSIALA